MHGMILIAATPAGRHAVNACGAIGIPVALRRLYRIECGPLRRRRELPAVRRGREVELCVGADPAEMDPVHCQGISTHWLRQTTLTRVERHFGYAKVRACAGHIDNAKASRLPRRASTGAATTTHINDNPQDVATASPP